MANGRADVELLFGASEGSFGQINSDLEKIIEKINEKPIGIKFELDKTAGEDLAKQVSEIVASISKNNEFAVEIPKLDLTDSAVEDFKQRIKSIIGDLPIGDGIKVGTITGDTGNVGAGMEQAATAAHAAAQEAANLQRAVQNAADTAAHMNFGAAVDTVTTLRSKLSDLKIDPGAVDQMAAQLDDMQVSVEQINAQWDINEKTQERLLRTTISGTDAQGRQLSLVQTYNAKTGEVSTTVANVTANFKKQATEAKKAATEIEKVNQAMRSIPTQIDAIQSSFSKLGNPTEGLSTSVSNLSGLVTEVENAAPDKKADAYKRLKEEIQYCRQELAALNGIEDNTAQLDKVSKTLSTTRGLLDKWSSAKYGDSATRDAYSDIEKAAASLEELEAALTSSDKPIQDFGVRYKSIISSISNARAVIQGSGRDVQSFGNRFAEAAKKFSSWLSVSQVIMLLVRSIKKMVTSVIEIDTAMTELRKVTDETEATYTKFLANATQRAKQLGATVSDVVSASADFARFGYTIDEALQLADAAIIYKNVGDGIEDIGTASESIISTMKAFKIEAADVMSIVDKFNKVGKFVPNNAVMRCKKIAISVKGRGRLRPRKDFVV